MSTSFDVETHSDRTPTVQELMDALFALPQFARTGIRRDEIRVQLRGSDEILPPEQYAEVTLDRCWCFLMKDYQAADRDDTFFIGFRRDFERDEAGSIHWWAIESRAMEDGGRALYVAIPCALAMLTGGLTGSGDSAWHNGRDDYTGAEMWEEFVQTELPYCYMKRPFFCPALNAELIVEGGVQWGRKVPEPYMRRCQEVLLNMPDVLLDAICEAAKKYWLSDKERLRKTDRSIPVTADSPAREMLKYIRFSTLALYDPKDESQTGYGLFGQCDWGERGDIEAEILDGRLLYLGGVDVMSPWDYDKCREEWYEAAGSYEQFDNGNYAL